MFASKALLLPHGRQLAILHISLRADFRISPHLMMVARQIKAITLFESTWTWANWANCLSSFALLRKIHLDLPQHDWKVLVLGIFLIYVCSLAHQSTVDNVSTAKLGQAALHRPWIHCHLRFLSTIRRATSPSKWPTWSPPAPSRSSLRTKHLWHLWWGIPPKK